MASPPQNSGSMHVAYSGTDEETNPNEFLGHALHLTQTTIGPIAKHLDNIDDSTPMPVGAILKVSLGSEA